MKPRSAVLTLFQPWTLDFSIRNTSKGAFIAFPKHPAALRIAFRDSKSKVIAALNDDGNLEYELLTAADIVTLAPGQTVQLQVSALTAGHRNVPPGDYTAEIRIRPMGIAKMKKMLSGSSWKILSSDFSSPRIEIQVRSNGKH